jgi:hypothetical protein
VHQNAELVYVPGVTGPRLLTHSEVHTLHIGHLRFAGRESEIEREGGEDVCEGLKMEARDGYRSACENYSDRGSEREREPSFAQDLVRTLTRPHTV